MAKQTSDLPCDNFIESLQDKFGRENLAQWIDIKANTQKPNENSNNLKQTADIIYFEGKNGHIGYSLPLNKFTMHYDCDNDQNISCLIGFYIVICYSSNESRPIFLSINNRICEGILCQDIIGDFSAETAEWRLFGPFVIDLNDDNDDNENKQQATTITDTINVKFQSSGYFPHITEFKFIPIAVYNLSKQQQIYKAIDFKALVQEQNKSVQHQNLDILIVDAIKRRSLHKTKSYQNFTSNILLYIDSSNEDSVKPSDLSKNMKFEPQYICCDGKNGFIEYLIQIKRSDMPTMTKTYDHQFNLTLGIEYSSPDSRPLQLVCYFCCFRDGKKMWKQNNIQVINDAVTLKDICDETIKPSYDVAAAWRIYQIDLHSARCRLRINKDCDIFEFALKLETDGYFPHIKSIMLMEYEPVKETPKSAGSDSMILNETEKTELKQEIEEDKKDEDSKDNEDEDDGKYTAEQSASFLKLATAYRDFITPPSDLIAFEPFISSVRNICFDTYFNGPPYTVVEKTEKEDGKKNEADNDDTSKEYPDCGITQDNETFIPDHKFYHSRNVDGLWICVSRNCDNYQQILDEATFLIKSFIPIEIRRLFLKYKHGRYRRKYCGPMRLIILSHTKNEQAGCIPELKTKEQGRNGTAQPFIFSSSDDYNRGFYHYQWFNGRLTAHELVHAVDMVIRQLIDPCFMIEVEMIYNLAKQSGEYPEKAYAMNSRHEYISEILTVFLNIPPNDLFVAGFRNKDDLKKRDPSGYKFLQKWFIEPSHTLPVLDVYKKFNGTL